MLVSDCMGAQQQENKQWGCWSRTSVLILWEGLPAILSACLITCRAQRATQWAAETRCSFGSSRWPFTYHSSSLPAAQLQPDLPLLPPSTVPPSASHTVDSTNNRLLSMHTHTHEAQKHQRKRADCCRRIDSRDKAAFACMGCVSSGLIHLYFHAFVTKAESMLTKRQRCHVALKLWWLRVHSRTAAC